MKISTSLPQFSQPHLLIAAGKQEATFYVAHEDNVTQVHTIKIKKPQYTDREGRSDKRVGGKMFQSGSAYESQDEETTRSLIKQMAEEANVLVNEHKTNGIYLFCPTYLSNRMEAGLSVELQNKVEYIFYGNYNHQHPFVLLSKIQEQQRQAKEDSSVEPINNEALSILKKTASFPHI